MIIKYFLNRRRFKIRKNVVFQEYNLIFYKNDLKKIL